MKTIVHLVPDHNPFPPIYPAGTELRVAEVSRRQRRYRPVVICGGFPGQAVRERDGSMEIERIHVGAVYRRLFQKITRLDPWPYAARLWQRLQAIKPDLVHIHNEPKLLAMLAPHLSGSAFPIVVHIANDKPIRPELIPLVTRWVACSRYMAEWLHDTYAVPRERIEVIHTGVDVAQRPACWQLSAADRAAARGRWGVKEDELVFLFAGRLVKEKGVAEMLDAFERLRLDRPVRLLVAGNVRESKDPKNEKATYGRAMAARMANMPGVTWVGSLHPGKIHEFLLAGDVFLLPSLWHDPFPTVMVEAACAGLPIIAAARGGMTEFLADCPGLTLLDKPEDPAVLSAVMADLANDQPRRESIGRWLRARVEEQYDWARVAEDFETLYDRLLQPASSRA